MSQSCTEIGIQLKSGFGVGTDVIKYERIYTQEFSWFVDQSIVLNELAQRFYNNMTTGHNYALVGSWGVPLKMGKGQPSKI